ncbi:MAG: valine--tRNA ligase, partial [Myxococcota bacterium]
LPIVGRLIPIIADTILPDPEKGTGAVKVTPAHDPNDFACGERHDLELIQVIGLDARMIAENVPEGYGGLDRYAARKQVVQQFEELGLLDRIESITYFPGRSERSDVVVEPLVMKQWFVKGEPLAKPAIEAVESGRTRIIPELWKKTYDHFMYNIRDWCISRQLWWGHQIPAWYGPDGKAFVAIDAQTALANARAHYGHDEVELEQDPDVLDTWFSSGLWPFSTLGWPERTTALEKFYPTAVLETGSDILFFWVARMMMMGLYAMGEVPFTDVFLHAMVRDERGQKMSKVKGNVIDPLHMIGGAALDELDPKAHRELRNTMESEGLTELPPQGADALRLTLAILAAQANDIKLDTSRMAGYRRFLNKLWNASKFVLMNIDDAFEPAPWSAWSSPWTETNTPFVEEHLNLADRWILTQLDTTILQVTEALEAYKFNDAAQAVYDFVWNMFCDWYIEASKVTLYNDSPEHAAHRAAAQATAIYVLETSLRLLHPITPFITEDIWQALPKGAGSPRALIVADWPITREASRFPEATEVFDVARDIISAVRNIRGETGVAPSKTIDNAWLVVSTDAQRAACEAGRHIIISRAMAKIGTLHIVSAAELPDLGPTATAVASGIQIQIPMAGLIDVAEETVRLTKELERVQTDINHVSRKLSNPKFVERAPDAIVQKERDKLAAFEKEQAALQASLDDLKALS